MCSFPTRTMGDEGFKSLPFLPELVLECLQFGVPFQLEHIGKVIFVL